MNDAFAGRERRKHRRFNPRNVRVWCISGEFTEMYTTVNFAKRLFNVGLLGACIETTGRLRPDVKMSLEVRFEDLGGTVRSQARVVWVDTVKEGGQEIYRAGLWFQGEVEVTKPVREYFEGADPVAIVAKRQAEFEDLKQRSQARKEAPAGRKWGLLPKLAAAIALLVLLYGGSFWGLVFRGRTPAPDASITYRYLGAGSGDAETEQLLARLYAPAYWVFREVGANIAYDGR